MKKILYVITKSNYGGAQRYVHELAVAMQENGHSVVVAAGGNGTLIQKLDAAGIRTREIKSYQRNINLLKEFRSLAELWQLYREEQPDVVHLNSSKASVTGGCVARLARVPRVVLTIHGWPFLEPRGFIWRTCTWVGMYFAVLFAHAVIPISKYDRAHASMPFTHKKFTGVIHNGVSEKDIAFNEKRAARVALVGEDTTDAHQNDLWLITSAELHPKKNLASAITAVAAFNKKNNRKAFYLIMGDGILREQLANCVKQNDAEDSVQLLGYVESARTHVIAGDAFMLPSKQEGLPYALLEAGIAGLPIIAGDVCGIPELIENEKTGLLIDPYEPNTITEAITKLANSPELCAQLGAALKEKVQKDFSFSTMSTQTERAYHTNDPRD